MASGTTGVGSGSVAFVPQAYAGDVARKEDPNAGAVVVPAQTGPAFGADAFESGPVRGGSLRQLDPAAAAQLGIVPADVAASAMDWTGATRDPYEQLLRSSVLDQGNPGVQTAAPVEPAQLESLKQARFMELLNALNLQVPGGQAQPAAQAQPLPLAAAPQ